MYIRKNSMTEMYTVVRVSYNPIVSRN